MCYADFLIMRIRRERSSIPALVFAFQAGACIVTSSSMAEVRSSPTEVASVQAVPAFLLTTGEDEGLSGPAPEDLVYAKLGVGLAGLILAGVGGFAIAN